jgi:hypothetical protein
MTPERWEKVNELFHSAIACAPSLRAAFLNQACGNDVGLLREVESLIRSHQKTETFIDSPVFEIARDQAKENQPHLVAGYDNRSLQDCFSAWQRRNGRGLPCPG